MIIHLTEAQARALGIKQPKKRTTKRTAPRAGSVSQCKTCDEIFTTDAAETNHVEATGHARIESVLA